MSWQNTEAVFITEEAGTVEVKQEYTEEEDPLSIKGLSFCLFLQNSRKICVYINTE